MRRAPALALLASVTACGTAGPPPAAVTVREGDPLVRATLNEPVMTDSALAYQSNVDAVRPPDIPLTAPVPAIDVVPAGPVADAADLPRPAGACPACTVARGALTLDTLAERLGGEPARACLPAVRYSAIWATRLPADLPLPPAARVIEAMGGDGAGCSVRAVAYGAALPLRRLLATEYARATRAGYRVRYTAEGGLHVLEGRGGAGGFTLVASDGGGGVSDARLVMTAGG